jgi:hypothetical protein
MKLTKTIKEYVTIKVDEVYRARTMKMQEDFHSTISDPIEKILQDFCDEANEKLSAKLKEEGYWDNIDEDGQLLRVSPYYSVVNNEHQTLRGLGKKLDKERADKITEILATLELGGTKADLDEMLRKL